MKIFRILDRFNRALKKNYACPTTTIIIHRFISSSTMANIDPVQKAALRENCIRVDEFDNELGPVSKEDCHLLNKDNSILLHRAFSVFIFNRENKLLLQQRSSVKVTYPNYFTNACCSHPLYDIEQERNGVVGVKLAVQRRLNFELGIPFDECPLESLKYLTRLHYFSAGDGTWGEHEIDYVFILHRDVTLNINPNEVQRITYVSPDELTELKEYPFTPWFQLISTYWLKKWWDNLHRLHMYQDGIIHKFNDDS